MPRPFYPARTRRTLFEALLQARALRGGARPILEDHDRKPLSYTDLVRASFALGRRLKRLTAPRERVAVLLPTGVGWAAVFFALHVTGRTPVMLNFTAGPRNLRSACRTAGVKRVLTARRFVQQAKLETLVAELEQDVAVTPLEDLRKQIGPADKAYAAAAALAPRLFMARGRPDEPAVILFTSGSFGAPKGVVLSHANLLANVEQVAAHIDLDPEWRFFNPLPTFHALGLIAALIPLMEGMRGFLYPSPLHAKQIPNLVKASNADVLFATDTFLNQYLRAGEDADLAGLKFVVCGAEKVREETPRTFAERLPGMPLLEGYGATECSPVIAVNQPTDNRGGTVGRLLPAIEARIEPVPGITDGGLLHVRGPNVMAGYLLDPDTVERPDGGWYDTGDVVSIDDEGLVRLKGRVKRFAKIGGEMVSLTAVEELAAGALGGARCAAVSIPDSRKGERLVLFTEHPDPEVGIVAAHAKAQGAPELAVPKRIVRLDAVPVLGTGKIDYPALQRLAEDEGQAAA